MSSVRLLLSFSSPKLSRFLGSFQRSADTSGCQRTRSALFEPVALRHFTTGLSACRPNIVSGRGWRLSSIGRNRNSCWSAEQPAAQRATSHSQAARGTGQGPVQVEARDQFQPGQKRVHKARAGLGKRAEQCALSEEPLWLALEARFSGE